MAKRKAATEAQAEEEFNEAHPEVDSQESGSLSEGKPQTKADAVRAAIAAGHTTGKPGTEYIKRTFGMDVTPGTFAATKASFHRRGEDAGESRPRATPASHAPAPSGGIPSGFGADVKAIKELIQTAGGGEQLKDLAGTIGALVQKYGVSGMSDLIDAFEE